MAASNTILDLDGVNPSILLSTAVNPDGVRRILMDQQKGDLASLVAGRKMATVQDLEDDGDSESSSPRAARQHGPPILPSSSTESDLPVGGRSDAKVPFSLSDPAFSHLPLKTDGAARAAADEAFPVNVERTQTPLAKFKLDPCAYPPPPHKYGPVVLVSCYTDFSDLAHGPRGTEAARAMRSYRLNISDGTLTLLSLVGEKVMHNPAFTRRHPSLPIVYTCTESVKKEGQIISLKVEGSTGALDEHCARVGAGGTSTCYLTIHPKGRRMLLVNYWDSTINTLELEADGTVGRVLASYDPKLGKPMKASSDEHVNHSRNDDEAQAERQGDPHAHAVVLDPASGCIAYVPDLGMDVIRQLYFDEASGTLSPCGEVASGIKVKGSRRGLGPRYMQFHPSLNMAYVVNELSSEIAVFEFHPAFAANIAMCATVADKQGTAPTDKQAVLARAAPTLSLAQSISTLPEAYPRELNTCGRVTIHPTGDFVVTSNRGHDSVAVHRIHKDSTPPGLLTLAGIFHTRGETPRHFQFDKTGQWLLVANQDSNTVAVFGFNCSTGAVTYSGNTYPCQSPNFVCVWDGA